MEKKRHINSSNGQLPTSLTHQLNYEIHSWSGHLSNFHPKNVLQDLPLDKNSRWSTDNNKQSQFIILELENCSVLEKITFGKFQKPHICNLKMFKVYGGINLNDLTEILEEGLSNDSVAETFYIKYNTNGIFPCKYIKIVPLASWGSRINYSIWYLRFDGIDEKNYVHDIYQKFNMQLEKKVIRLCLKYFRQRHFETSFKALEKDTGVQLEDITLTNLYQLLVKEGDFSQVEELLIRAYNDNLFDEYCKSQPYTYNWRRIFAYDENGLCPMPRGGHQFCYNPNKDIIYLLGGWDGNHDLGDFWYFDIKTEKWHLISDNTINQSGPGPRSCFKTCFDNKQNKLYVFGKYMSSTEATSNPPKADFYCYEQDSNKWTLISEDVKSEDGPSLIFDHQMAIDQENQIIYISGGRKITPLGPDMKPPKARYSKLFKYDIKLNKWEKLSPRLNTDLMNQQEFSIVKRNSHSMMFDPKLNQLIILAGDRNNSSFLSDMYIYDINNNIYKQVYRDYSSIGGPLPGFAQSANIDEELREIYIFSGISKDKEITPKSVCNNFFMYGLIQDTFVEIYKNDIIDNEYWDNMANIEPMPRFAHQMVYKTSTKIHYLFGGNPNSKPEDKGRLDDLWEFKLIRPKSDEILRKAKLMIRKHKYLELCESNSLEALNYLRDNVFPLLNNNNSMEVEHFQSLPIKLFQTVKENEDTTLNNITTNVPLYSQRVQLYENLILFFPNNMKQPTDNLIEIVKLQ